MTSKSKSASNSHAHKSSVASVPANPTVSATPDARATSAVPSKFDDEEATVRREMAARGSSSYDDEQMLRRAYEAGKVAAGYSD